MGKLHVRDRAAAGRLGTRRARHRRERRHRRRRDRRRGRRRDALRGRRACRACRTCTATPSSAAWRGWPSAAGRSADSFWTWREVMYRFLDRLDARRRRGDRRLRLRGDAGGRLHRGRRVPLPAPRAATARPYADIAETGRAHRGGGRRDRHRADAAAGVLRPGRLRRRAAGQGQRRFLNDLDGFARLVEASARGDRRTCGCDARHRAAFAARRHPRPTWPGSPSAGRDGPIHIHVAEQVKEVEDALAAHGQRPVDGCLYDTVAVDRRWCLIHATHMTAPEIELHRRVGRRRRAVPDHRGQSRRRHFR